MQQTNSLIITDEFKACLDEVDKGTNVFITGKAGTGKSTLLRLICTETIDKNIAVVAPTGVAALNVDGTTIHKFFGFRPDLTAELLKYRPPADIQHLDMLIIDEASMLRADVIGMVDTSLKRAKKNRLPFGGIQLILIGDLFQLPPVVDREEVRDTYYATDFFFSSPAFTAGEFKKIELTRVFRQREQQFIDVLNSIRDGSVGDEHLQLLNTRYDPTHMHSNEHSNSNTQQQITLATTNKKIDEINLMRLEDLPGSAITYKAAMAGDWDKKKHKGQEEIQLKPGAQVMLLVNQDGYANGTIAEVKKVKSKSVTVYIPDQDETKVIEPHFWETFKSRRKNGTIIKEVVGTFKQLPLKLAWAVTVHKSQGLTFDNVVFDPSRIFDNGQTYVALSRCTSLAGLTLTNPIEQRHVKVSPAVIKFNAMQNKNNDSCSITSAPPAVSIQNNKNSSEKIVAIDFETFNNEGASACAVGIAIIENEEITKTYKRHMRPPRNDLDPFCFRTHGISWDHVKDEPSFEEVWKDVSRDVSGASYFVAHNAGSDERILSSCCDFYGLKPPSIEFLCSLELSRQYWELESYALERVCQFHKIPLRPHDPQSDAEASAKILLRGLEHGYEIGENIEGDEVKVLSEAVMAVVDTVMRDGKIEADEIHSASEWLNANSDAAAVWPGIALKATLEKILEDGSIDDSELADFHELCCTLLGIQERKKRKRSPYKSKPGQLSVCFTGFGAKVIKEELQDAAELAGFHVAKSIIKKLNYLVCGPEPGPKKLEKASAQGVTILSIEDWKELACKKVST